MKMKISPLQLELIFFEKEKLEVKPLDCSEEYRPINNSINFKVSYGKTEDDVNYRAIKFSLNVNKNKKNSPFKVELEGLALFSIAETENLPEEKIERMFIFNGTSMVFSFLRGYIFFIL